MERLYKGFACAGVVSVKSVGGYGNFVSTCEYTDAIDFRCRSICFLECFHRYLNFLLPPTPVTINHFRKSSLVAISVESLGPDRSSSETSLAYLRISLCLEFKELVSTPAIFRKSLVFGSVCFASL